MSVVTRHTEIVPHIRWTIRRDLPLLAAIEENGCSEPLTADQIADNCRHRQYIAMTAEQGNRILGYMGYFLCKNHLELARIVVDVPCRRRSVGRYLIEKLGSKLTPHRRHVLRAYVPESYLEVQQFLRSTGLRATGVRRNHFEEAGEDAYVMELYADDLPTLTREV